MIVYADTFEPRAMRELFNAGFSGYLVPMQLDDAAFAAHVERNDIDLTASPVLVDGDPISFTLVAIRGSEAWIGGMGTVPAARRGGRGRQSMQAALDSARARGCSSVWLEVIDANRPAVALYEQLGFEIVRDLLVWRLAPSSGRAEASTLELGAARRWIVSQRDSPEPWQRADPVLDRLAGDGEPPRAIAVEQGGELTGAAVYEVVDGSARMLQLEAVNEAAAEALLRSLAGDGPVILGNFPEDGPASRAMKHLGGELFVRQHEMRLAL